MVIKINYLSLYQEKQPIKIKVMTTRELIEMLSALGEDEMNAEIRVHHTQQQCTTTINRISTQDSGDGDGSVYVCIDTAHKF